jgi:hypothetical protein
MWSAEVSGYAIGALFISFAISYLIAGRKKSRKPVLFGLFFVGVTSVLCLMELSHPRENPRAKVVDLLREANGAKPVDRSGTAESPQDRLTREVMTELLDNVKANREKTQEVKADIQTIYTPESFSSPQAMSRARDSVEKITALDHEFVLQLEEWPVHVQQQTARSSLSETDKKAFPEGVNESFSNSEIVTLRKEGDQIEAQWCKDTLALYDFARLHAGQIHVKDARILIDDENARPRFNELLQQSRTQHQRMTDTNARLAKLQQDNLQKLGLTRRDVGVVDPSGSKTE